MARLELLIMIQEFGLSCYLAAKILNLSYPQSKMIYRIFKRENRIRSHFKKPKFPGYVNAANAISSCQTLKDDCLRKLKAALHTNLLSDRQKEKIYDTNFDVVVVQPTLIELENVDKNFARS